MMIFWKSLPAKSGLAFHHLNVADLSVALYIHYELLVV